MAVTACQCCITELEHEVGPFSDDVFTVSSANIASLVDADGIVVTATVGEVDTCVIDTLRQKGLVIASVTRLAT